MLPNGLKEIVDADTWKVIADKIHVYPLFTARWFKTDVVKHPHLNFVLADIADIDEKLLLALEADATVVLILESFNEHAMAELRRSFITLLNRELKIPVIIKRAYSHKNEESLILAASTDVGGLLIDGLGDGIYLSTNKLISENKTALLAHLKNLNNVAFGILQAARTRMTKTEYISCPSCGRTLFDLQETTALIRKRTDHLKGVKIGIMGCIVNGPGEMADADYGYVGVGKDKIALYRGQTVVKKAVSADKAVDELINIIKEDGKWLEPIVSEYV
jgi:(E)-4-hydroxy-3-methylbut-2-enyl-diphosphate synthase